MDTQQLDRELDRTKSQVFIGSNAAFLGSLMCSMEFRWMPEIATAETDGTYVGWNPEFFLALPKATRQTVLMHELWHPARLHMVRAGSRDHEIWNWACDIRINNDLERMGYSFVGIEWAWKEQEIDQGPEGRLAEEQIYDILVARNLKPPPQPGNGGDMREPTKEQIRAMINNVVQAIHQAKASGAAGTIPGEVEQVINKFLAPIVPWEILLMRFFTDMQDTKRTWARPNRRYPDIYLPSDDDDDGRLEHLIYYVDVSGSVSNADVLRCNSEVKYIKEVMNPKKLTLCLFDTKIQQEFVFLEDDPFEKLVITGRGGTSFVPVREHINKHNPTCAVIFSDMACGPMAPLDYDTPVIWIAVNARNGSVPFGKIIHIRN